MSAPDDPTLTNAEREVLHKAVCALHRDDNPGVWVCRPCEAVGDAAVERILAARARPAPATTHTDTAAQAHAYGVETLWNAGGTRERWGMAMEMSDYSQPLSRDDAEELVRHLLEDRHAPEHVRLVAITAAKAPDPSPDPATSHHYPGGTHCSCGERLTGSASWTAHVTNLRSDSASQIALLADLLREATEHETGPCRLDHHGNCQEHGYFGGPCLIPRARAALSATGAPE